MSIYVFGYGSLEEITQDVLDKSKKYLIDLGIKEPNLKSCQGPVSSKEGVKIPEEILAGDDLHSRNNLYDNMCTIVIDFAEELWWVKIFDEDLIKEFREKSRIDSAKRMELIELERDCPIRPPMPKFDVPYSLMPEDYMKTMPGMEGIDIPNFPFLNLDLSPKELDPKLVRDIRKKAIDNKCSMFENLRKIPPYTYHHYLIFSEAFVEPSELFVDYVVFLMKTYQGYLSLPGRF